MTTTTYLSDQIIETYFATPTGLYIALHTGDPGTAGTANELVIGTDANYVRKAVDFVKSADGLIYVAKNNADVVFNAAASGASYTVTHITVKSASTGGNTLAVLALVSPLPTVAGTVNSFATNDIVIRGES
jgi:hypothetical protein